MRYIKTGAKIEQIKLYCVEANCGDFSKEKWRLGAFTSLKKAKEFIKSEIFKKGEKVVFKKEKLGDILNVVSQYPKSFENLEIKKLRIRPSTDFLIFNNEVIEMKKPCFLNKLVKIN